MGWTSLFLASLWMGTSATHAQVRLSAERVYAGSALFAVSPPGDTTRLFLVSKTGETTLIKNGAALPTLFLNLQGTVYPGVESGLLGLAFHPQFAQNGYCYFYYSTISNVTIARYTTDPANPDRADPSSVVIVLTIPRGPGIHWGGWMAFGPDGYLYIASGNAGIGTNSSATNTLFGKLLRVDVDHDDFPADPGRNYAIPPTNPFYGSTTNSSEIWAYGLRNPWRCSFDRMTGDLWIADVGDGAREEVDFQPAANTPPFSARNYGYPNMEGSICNNNCGPELILPVFEYAHTLGTAIVGGYVYRGARIPQLQGAYLCGDYTSNRRWCFQYDASGIHNLNTVEIVGLPTVLASFGEDADGELYACGTAGVYRLIPFCSANCDNSVIPPILNINDFQCFLNQFAAADAGANCDGSTSPPILNVNDFQCFINRFAEGCP